MPLNPATLVSELESALTELTGESAPDAKTRICEAWGVYFKESTLAGIPVNSAAVDSGVSTMASAMTFVNGATAAAGANVFLLGLTAFWTHLQGNAPTYWAAATPGTPSPGLGAVSASLIATFAANNVPGITIPVAAAALATSLATCGVGGTLTVAGSPTPIL